MKIHNKILTVSALQKTLTRHRRQGKTVAFTNGCFDIIHYGHVSYLQKAKKKNRILVVGLNSDASVKKIKGAGRPIVPQRQRAAVLAALVCVDYVTIFNGETPYAVIKALQPDILIKGADWKNKTVIGRDIVAARGGRVELIRYVKGCSTSKIIAAMRKKCKK